MTIQPALGAPVVNYEFKNQASASVEKLEKEQSKVVDFANMLLAKHEANMRQREIEGLYPVQRNSFATGQQDRKVSPSETSITVFSASSEPNIYKRNKTPTSA